MRNWVSIARNVIDKITRKWFVDQAGEMMKANRQRKGRWGRKLWQGKRKPTVENEKGAEKIETVGPSCMDVEQSCPVVIMRKENSNNTVGTMSREGENIEQEKCRESLIVEEQLVIQPLNRQQEAETNGVKGTAQNSDDTPVDESGKTLLQT